VKEQAVFVSNVCERRNFCGLVDRAHLGCLSDADNCWLGSVNKTKIKKL
jgi:hypothetical protein